MKNYNRKPYYTFIIILVIGVVLFVSFVLYQDHVFKTSEKPAPDFSMSDKVYGVNEYSPVVVTDQQMATIYLNNYFYYLRNDLEKAYSLVDKDYIKKNNFTFSEFIKLVNSMNIDSSRVLKYSLVSGESGKTMYYINNSSDVTFIFITDGVMTYKVKFSY